MPDADRYAERVAGAMDEIESIGEHEHIVADLDAVLNAPGGICPDCVRVLVGQLRDELQLARSVTPAATSRALDRMAAELHVANGEVQRLHGELRFAMGPRMYEDIQKILDGAIGGGADDGAGAGLVADVQLLADRMAEYRTSNEQLGARLQRALDDKNTASAHFANQYARMYLERDQARTQVERVRARHVGRCGGACASVPCQCEPGDLVCAECEKPHPCPTVLALDSAEDRP